MDELFQFLSLHRTESRPTHISLFHPKGKFTICHADLPEFWRLYNYYYGVTPLGIAEMQTSLHIPILVDIDLKIEKDVENPCTEPLYTRHHVETIVRVYQRVLNEILVDVQDGHNVVFLFEKPAYEIQKNSKTFRKNGFHLHFPFIFMSRYQQEHVLLPRIRMECKKLEEGDLPYCVTADTLIDRSYCRGSGSSWLLYGSRKDESMDPYMITCGYTKDGVIENDWWRLLSGFTYDGNTLTTREEIEEHLPQIFSIQVEGRTEYIYEIKNDICAVNWDKPPVGLHKTNPPCINGGGCVDTETLDKIIEGLLPLLSDERASDRNEWMRIGWILYNVYNGSEKGYTYWVEFSKRCVDKFNESVCHYEWSRMEKKDMTMATLKFLARQDSPEKYAEYVKNLVQPYIDRCLKLDGAHNDLALVLFKKYDSEFKCASINSKLWYQFKDHTWNRIEDGFTLRKRISSEIVEDYENIAKQHMNRVINCEDEEDSKAHKKKMTCALKMIQKLKTSTYKTHVMKEAMEIFYDEHFLKKLDSDPYLIAFHNGIYDLKNHIFREGTPNDCVSLKMNINYRNDLTHESPEVKMVTDFFEKIFPDNDVRTYFIDTSCDVFIGGNFNKIVQVWTGDGDNGKSITQSIFEQMLGCYAVKLPTSLIVGKRTQSSAACPELVRAGNGVRLAVLQEPDQKDTINVGILKELSGNDTFFARGLFKEGGEINPMFKLVLICNEPPKLPHNDRATWNRIRVIPFEATFSDNAPETYEEQLREKIFPKDTQFKDKIPGMVEALAWFLLERLKVKPKVIHEPEKVKLATANYRRKNDVYRMFAEEFIVDDAEKSLQLLEVYSTFKDWFRESFPNTMVPSKMDMKEYFVKIWGEPFGPTHVWDGHTIRTNFEI